MCKPVEKQYQPNSDIERRLNNEIQATMDLNENIHKGKDEIMSYHTYLECLLWIKTGIIKD
mgnify:FL=1|tara:strand:- start:518 stop:700 length:183 start_codon:yes stop_codon:yes gene_type:complete